MPKLLCVRELAQVIIYVGQGVKNHCDGGILSVGFEPSTTTMFKHISITMIFVSYFRACGYVLPDFNLSSNKAFELMEKRHCEGKTLEPKVQHNNLSVCRSFSLQ